MRRPASPPMAFVFGGWVFDITAAAAAIIHAEPRETVSLLVWSGGPGRGRGAGRGLVAVAAGLVAGQLRLPEGGEPVRGVGDGAGGAAQDPGLPGRRRTVPAGGSLSGLASSGQALRRPSGPALGCLDQLGDVAPNSLVHLRESQGPLQRVPGNLEAALARQPFRALPHFQGRQLTQGPVADLRQERREPVLVDSLGALGATRRAVVKPRAHRLGHRVRSGGPWCAAQLLAQLGHRLQDRRLGRAGHPPADPLAVGSEPEADRASPASYPLTVELGVSALVAVPVLEGCPARCWHARNPTPRAAPVGPL